MLERESRDFNEWVDDKLSRSPSERLKAALDEAEDMLSDPNNFRRINAGTITSDKLASGSITMSPGPFIGIDPGNPNGIAFYDGEMSVMEVANSELKHWLPERPIANKPSNHDMGTAIDMQYDGGRMPARLHEMMAVRTREILRSAPRQPSFRRGHSRDAIIQNIVRNTQVLEPEWDVASMVDAHRNGCTALDEQRTDLLEVVSTPVFEELATVMFDPGCEMGPRERDWHRRQRNQPTNKSRKQRKGKKR